MHAAFRQGRLAATALLALALAACVTMPEDEDETPSADATRAEQLFKQGDMDQAAAAFGTLADSSGGDTSAHYRLREAEAQREAGDLDGAARTLGDVKRRRLHGSEQIRLDVLDAEIALKHDDPAKAQALLTMPVADLSPSLRARALELRARAEVGVGDRYAAARTRAELDRYLEGPDRDANRKEIVDTLTALGPDALKTRAETLRPDDPLRPWIEQALRSNGIALARTMPRPNRPVGTVQPGQGGTTEGYIAPKHVALLLPLGSLAAVSQSIRDGFLAAYFAADDTTRPDVRIYDSGKTPADAVAAYKQAVADGADHIVGPLQREAVGELFHQTLTAPVLALNHPDTGEVPPPGSAEFGLLPDAEGAQVAEHMHERGITRAAVITADTDWAQRAALAFRAQFEASGGQIVGATQLRENEVNFKAAIQQSAKASAILPTPASSSACVRSRRVSCCRSSRSPRFPRRCSRHRTSTAAMRTPASIATSTASNSAMRRGCSAPCRAGRIAPSSAARSRARTASARGSSRSAWTRTPCLPYLGWLLTHPDAYLSGATGDLTADSFGRVHRLIGWARFDQGVAHPIDGALAAMPATQ